jgi:group I intron endonuclease
VAYALACNASYVGSIPTRDSTAILQELINTPKYLRSIKLVRAYKKKWHYIYKTTNLLDGKFYVGMHSTNNLNDDYLGSGKRIKSSINKYGKENFRKEILEFLPSRELLVKRESEIIDEEFLCDKLCLNLRLGGTGGWEHLTKEQKSLGGKRGSKTFWENPKLAKEAALRASMQMKRLNTEGKMKQEVNPFLGKTHSNETLEKMKAIKIDHGLGESNSQFGTCWIHHIDLKISKKINKNNLDSFIVQGWIKGRKLFKQLLEEC